jgi:hypothetical protein
LARSGGASSSCSTDQAGRYLGPVEIYRFNPSWRASPRVFVFGTDAGKVQRIPLQTIGRIEFIEFSTPLREVLFRRHPCTPSEHTGFACL